MNGWYRFQDQIDEAPNKEGVYLLSENSSDNIYNAIYVGRANDLKERLVSHPDPANPCLQRKQINFFAFEETMNSEERERELIEDINPDCNRI